ncbi:MAG: hypothetical protein ACHQM6_00445 [Candidatus Kapaibacterium sp.]
MVKYVIRLIFASAVFASGEVFAQTFIGPSDSTEAVRKIYDPSEISNETFHLTDEATFGDQLQFLYDDIERIASHPLSLETASWKDLQQIPTLNDLDIYRILSARKEITALPSDISESLEGFVKNTSAKTKEHISLQTMAVLDPDASQQSVYQNGSYHGSPVKTVSRIVAKNDDVLLSFVEAKDPGEPLYFDHLTGCFAITHSISITDDLSLSKFVAGDYSLSFGNGLLFSNNYTQLSSKRVTLNPATRSDGIQPYVSSSSSRFFRGAAAEVRSGILSVSGFFSDRKVDAVFDSSGKAITSFPSTGLHRTALELSRKDQAESRVAGGHVAVTPLQGKNFLEFGATGYSLNYDKPVLAKDSLSLGFSGQKHSMISLDMRSAFAKISWSAEFARMISDAGKANAFAMTLVGSPVQWMDISLNYRMLPEKFISLFGSTFGINSSGAQNETGWCLASKCSAITNKLWFFGSANFSESLNSLQSTLHYSDIILGGEYRIKSFPLDLLFQFRSYGKGPVFSISNDSLSKNSFRFDADADLTKTVSISLHTEFQRSYSQTENSAKSGHLVGVKMYYLPVQVLSVSSGIAFFETDSYASRFYSNEADLPGSATFVALYGIGYRYYLQLSYDLAARVTLSARAAETRYSATSGSPELHKTTIGAQFDLSL